MGNSTQSFKELFMAIYLPALLMFFGLIAAGTCISVGPFFPVGFAGLVTGVVMVYFGISLIKKEKKNKELKETISTEEDRVESIKKRSASDLAKKEAVINELKDTVAVLQKKLTEAEATKAKKEESPVEVKEEVKKSTKKATKTTKK